MVTLVTGATGFIGSRLIHHLERQGERTRALLRQSSDARALDGFRVDIVRGSLIEPKTLERAFDGVKTVYHIASPGLADMVRERLSPNEMISPLIGAALQSGKPRFIYLSTIKARLPRHPPGAGPQSLDVYGLRKRNEEQRLMREPDLPWTIVRASAVYGPGDRKSLPIFRLATGRIVPLIRKRRLGRFSMVHVEDLVGVLTRVATETAASRRLYEVGDSSGLDWNDLMRILSSPGARRVGVPPLLLRGIGRSLSMLSGITRGGGLLVSERVQDLLENDWLVDESLEFIQRPPREPRQSVTAGLLATLSWYQANGWLGGQGGVKQC